LGNGLVLTAAHVVGSAARTRPSVRIAGMDLPAKAVKEGNVERVDLTLLSINEQTETTDLSADAPHAAV
jgi:hypothetical protein